MAAHQPNYMPWLGFFDKMEKSDIFVIEDNLQFVYHEFHNRNKIKTNTGVTWLTVPVKEGRKRKKINEIQIYNEKKWNVKHWNLICQNYSKSSYWRDYCDFFENSYKKRWDKLVGLNMHLIQGIMEFLDIDKELVYGSSLKISGKNNELIIGQCKELGVKKYLSGIGAKVYLDIKKFRQEGIEVFFQNFTHPKYTQVFGDFISNLSVIDFLLCTGGFTRWSKLNDI